MKTLLRKLRHGVSDAPGIPIAKVRAALWNQVDKRCKLQGGGVERRTLEEILHSIRHRSLHRICLAQFLQALAPSVNLRTRTHLEGHTLSQDKHKVQAETLSLYF